ncbi:hypothetical protein BN891_53760 [Bacteroides xylanisolvens SD CC 2a]|nr:hypothetical protein BN891_22640 [Bacteroides xylanisolvens SD CC 2a]CDM01422.1 hypothetical protein BN891_43580 [Bacteroides xylanisolvens SD CC 2a]CDM02427.1 hypothetical protein BN891_53760 [Bacteroides xylanisolvens SD CC 2a]
MILAQSVSSPLQGGIRFFRYPIPTPHVGLPCGLLTSSDELERYGLTVFYISDK